jgi:hypothetical protein
MGGDEWDPSGTNAVSQREKVQTGKHNWLPKSLHNHPYTILYQGYASYAAKLRAAVITLDKENKRVQKLRLNQHHNYESDSENEKMHCDDEEYKKTSFTKKARL